MGLRVAVIGLGVAGLSAALACARRGDDVTGFEQYALGNDPASSGGRGKIIRYGYDDPFYAALMRETWPRWDALATATGRHILDAHGGLHLGDPAQLETVVRGIRDAGQPVEVISGDAEPSAPTSAAGDVGLASGEAAGATDGVTRVTPGAAEEMFGVRIGDGEPAAIEPTAGVMWPAETRAALAEAARAAGADLRAHSRVKDIDGLALRTAEGMSGFDRIILAGGPWAFRLAPEAAGAFAITRRFQVVFRTDGPLGDGRPRPWIDHAGIGYYGMINVAPGMHLIGLHELDIEQPVDDPDDPVDDEMRAWSVARSTEYVQRRFGVAVEPVDVRICHYTSTPSRDFVIDDCPGRPGVILLSPCSGHGFKFGITVGEYAARLAHEEIVPDRERFRRRSATMN